MAVVPMQRISICALKKDRKPILEVLQRRGVIELCDMTEESPIFYKANVTEPTAHLNRHKQMAKQALEILDNYSAEKKSMLSMFNGREIVPSDKYDEFVEIKKQAYKTAKNIIDLSKSILESKAEVIKLSLQKDMTEPWVNLDVPLNFTGTKSTAAFIGVLPGTWHEDGIYETFAEFAPLEVEILSVVREQTFVFILCLKEYSEKMFELLRMNGFSKPAIQGVLAPAKQQEEYEKTITQLEEDMAAAKLEIEQLASKRELIRFYADYEAMREEKYEAIHHLLHSKHTFVLTGYIPKRDSQGLKKDLEERYNVDIHTEDPAKEENVPVLLSNNSFASPLEGVTEGFSPPGKGEVDPTSVMALFYYLLFGIMFSDAGYGAVLTIGCGLILLKFKAMEESLKRSVKMFFFCGIATTFWGIVFSSYFGDAIDVISATFFGKIVSVPPLWFSPMAEPMRMLVFSMAFGLVHLLTGLGMKLYQCFKQKKYLDGIYDSVFWMVLVGSCVILLMSSQMFMNIFGMDFTLSKTAGNVSSVIAIVAALGIVATGGRESRNPGKRLMKGAYALYGITGYLSDVLSYSRLLALGLATGVIGTVINKMGSMPGNAILFILVFLVGHLLNFAINILGAYVHTNRLQYVEFFGKFYEGGGRKFEPFSAKTKYYKIREK